MANIDQAEGLRRMLLASSSRPRVVTFLSAIGGEEKNSTLVNLAAGLEQLGNDVILFDARGPESSSMTVAMWLETQLAATLVDVARQKCTMHQAVKVTPHGFKLASYCRSQHAPPIFQLSEGLLERLDIMVKKLGNSTDIILADGELHDEHGLSLAALEDGEIVILLTKQQDSLKAAYSLIKRAHGRYGSRPYGVLVTGVNQCEAQRVFDALAQVASSFLSVPLTLFGFVPQDDYLRRASRSGRSVIDAFPGAGASMAFSRLAQQMISPHELAHMEA